MSKLFTFWAPDNHNWIILHDTADLIAGGKIIDLSSEACYSILILEDKISDYVKIMLTDSIGNRPNIGYVSSWHLCKLCPKVSKYES
jgi:hypothetical protein